MFLFVHSVENNIKLKKRYSAPELFVNQIDNEMSLVMMSYTDPTKPPDPGGGGGPPPVDPDAAPSQFQNTTLKKNPFKETK